jgi:hypothetical protein
VYLFNLSILSIPKHQHANAKTQPNRANFIHPPNTSSKSRITKEKLLLSWLKYYWLSLLAPSPDPPIPPTSVGAILLFFFAFSPPLKPSSPSRSLSLASLSRFPPTTLLAVLLGVCGGVVRGIPVIKLTFPWAIPGILPDTRGGFDIIALGA